MFSFCTLHPISANGHKFSSAKLRSRVPGHSPCQRTVAVVAVISDVGKSGALRSPERTRLSDEFAVKQGINRENIAFKAFIRSILREASNLAGKIILNFIGLHGEMTVSLLFVVTGS